MKHILSLALCILGAGAFASSTYTTPVQSASCTQIAKQGSATGAIVGSTAGAGVGAVVGKSLFGKGGGVIGGLIGGIGGGVAGENMGATTTYRCIVGFTGPNGKAYYSERIGDTVQVGMPLTIFVSDDGKVFVR